MRQTLISLFFGIAAVLAVPATAGEYQDWLESKRSSTPKTSPPLFSDDEWNSLRDEYPFEYKFVDRNGILTPTLNGRFLIGVDYRYAPNPLEQNDYMARILAPAGINVMRSSVSAPRSTATIPIWKEKEEVFRRRGIATMLGLGINRIRPIVEDVYKNILKRPIPEAFTKWWGTIGGYGLIGRHYGDFFNAEYRRAHGEVLAEVLRALGPGSTVGYIFADESGPPDVGPGTEASARDWQAFVKRFYKDASPAEDTNGDGVTFNGFFKKSYSSWDQVRQFTKDECDENPTMLNLSRVWMHYGHARFIDTLSAECQKVNPLASVSEAYISKDAVSLLNAMPHNRYIGFGNYESALMTGYYAAFAHAYNKPGYAFHINKPEGNYYGARSIGVGSLPFTAAQIWWQLTVGRNDGKWTDWDARYCLANWWEINSFDSNDWGEEPNRLVEYDSRFLIIPQIAPFMGRFSSMPRELANGVLWLEPPVPQLVRNNHAVTEEALVLGGQKLDLDRYKLVIFMKSGPAKFAKTYQILRDYVRRGGTVLVNVNAVGAGTTILGQPNAQYWLGTCKIGRVKPQIVETGRGFVIYEDDFNDKAARWKENIISLEGADSFLVTTYGVIGAAPDGASGSFVYKFRIPERFEYFRITDSHTVWGKSNDVKMWMSTDNRTWQLVHDDQPRYVHFDFEKIFSLHDDLADGRDLYVKYYFKAGDPKRRPGDNRGAALRRFRLEGLTSEEVKALAEWSGDLTTTVQLDDQVHKFKKLEVFVRPGPGMKAEGVVADAKAKRPLVIVRTEGKGKWLLWNSPESVPALRPDRYGYDPQVWRAQWRLLEAAVRRYSQGRIEDIDDPLIVQGDGCLMGTPWGKSLTDYMVTFKSEYPKTVVYEVLDDISEGGPYIQTKNGLGTFAKDFTGRTATHLWVLKPYGKPILLCADGTVKNVMKIDDGQYEDGLLTFEMAEKATFSTPVEPKSATHNGRKVKIDYDLQTKIARIVGTGRLGQCVVEYHKPTIPVGRKKQSVGEQTSLLN